jgi:hypothetical protein
MRVKQNIHVSGVSNTGHVPGQGVCHRVPTIGSGVLILPPKIGFDAGSIGMPDQSRVQTPG